MRARPLTDRYLAAVEAAVATPGRWIDVRDFDTEANAEITGACLAGGYLRVQPRDGEPSVHMRGKHWLATTAPVAAKVEAVEDRWRLRIRATA